MSLDECWNGTAFKVAFVAGALSLAGVAYTASAGTVTFYDDRSAWLSDAAAAGLVVTTEEFAVEPVAFPEITLGNVSFTITSPRATHDATNERIGFTSGGGRALGLDLTDGPPPAIGSLFGFGLDLGPTIGNIRTTDVDGGTLASGGGGPAGHFLGLLGTAPLDPENPFPSNAALAFSSEFGTSGLALDVYFDNLSVATTVVPIPAAVLLLVSAIGVLGLVGRKPR